MHRFFLGLSRLMAIIGGIVLSLLGLIIVVSIIGRETGLGAVNGDYEIVEAGMAFAIFAFLPLAQITGGHASVDIFTSWLPDRAHRILVMIIEIIFAVVLIIIAVQLYEGTLSKLKRGQTTFLLQFPIWWAYAASLAGAVIAALVAIYTALVRIVEAFTGRGIAPEGMGAEH